ncbi:uncharacterized protein B0J16DRAFT_356217 [Fusarium flagelliforme]|uniref:uncharacterized protein n=1 Tax=Fusarium flagelliforme TaxID=2675880 RepID=UPI001E8D25D0|nr:uncharacterized protein B0J16DRAFT_356217 [Fusarium flagelliforme]KAH7186182.1 hypothetical protein B0J16DRAFT_356217 [Fusarium flagelliforme]
MLRRHIMPLALWVQLTVAFGSDMLELKTGSEMISLSDAAMNDILLPDTVSNFTEWIEDSNQMQSFGLHARQRQCPVPKARPASKAVVVVLVNPSAVLRHVTTLKHPSAAEVQVYIALKGMIVSQAVDVVLRARSDAGIVSAMIPRERHVVRDRALFGLAIRAMSVALLEVVQILRLRSVVRTEVVRKERRVARMSAVGRVDTVDQMDDIEPDTGNAPEFSCVPMTATNDVGATLELDTGCVLHYEAPEETSTGGRARRDIEAPTAAVAVNRGLLARQAGCTASTTYTDTVWKTEVYTETGTRTVTVAGDDATFSCPEMEVTNDVGDTLALDGECVLSFSPAEPTASDVLSAQGGGQAGGSQAGGGSAGPSAAAGGDNDSAGFAHEVWMPLTIGFAMGSVVWVAL